MAAVLSEGVLDQNGPKWSKQPFWSNLPYYQLDFSIRKTKMDQNVPFCPKEVYFGPFRSANRTPLTLQPLLFWKKQGKPRKMQGFFFFAVPLKSLEKKGRTHKKAREIGKRKKQGNRRVRVWSLLTSQIAIAFKSRDLRWPSNPRFFFFDFLVFLSFSDFPCFFVRFSFLFQGFEGFREEKNPLHFSGFPLLFFQKSKALTTHTPLIKGVEFHPLN